MMRLSAIADSEAVEADLMRQTLGEVGEQLVEESELSKKLAVPISDHDL